MRRLRWLVVVILCIGCDVEAAAMLTAQRLDQALRPYAQDTSAPVIVVDIPQQRLTLYQHLQAVRQYPISTSRYGVGEQSGSNRTPLGFHRVKRKIGADAQLGTIFKARVNTGRLAKIESRAKPTGDDFVTTRILWLEGLEPGKNAGGDVDSFHRYIYIHGTHEEGLIGRPASHGCIRMRNADVVDLFERVPRNTVVWIRNSDAHTP